MKQLTFFLATFQLLGMAWQARAQSIQLTTMAGVSVSEPLADVIRIRFYNNSIFSLTLPNSSYSPLIDDIRSFRYTDLVTEAPVQTEVGPVRVYPVPSMGPVRFETEADNRIFQIAVRDLMGRTVARADVSGTNSAGWDGLDHRGQPVPSGMYLCDLTTEKGRHQARIIINQ